MIVAVRALKAIGQSSHRALGAIGRTDDPICSKISSNLAARRNQPAIDAARARPKPYSLTTVSLASS